MNISEMAGNSQTLGERMAQGRIPVPDALRYAMLLAEALRKVHDSGQAHGAVSPGAIAITRTGLELLPALGSVGTVTPYTAPEVAEGRAADSRSDVFSFGTILYEMLTGRVAFSGEGAELTSALATAPPPSGSPAVDRLVASCVAKDPAQRWQRMQKLLLELKLLAVAVQRAETPRRETPDPAPAIRAEVQEMEARMSATLAGFEGRMDAVHEHIAGVEAALRQNAAELTRVEQALMERIERLERTTSDAVANLEKAGIERLARVEQAAVNAGHERLWRLEEAMGGAGDRMERLEGTLAAVRQDAATLRESVSDDLAMFDKALKSQNTAIESARTAMSQTDDLVERVVEALESLQSVVLDHADDREMVVN